MKYPKSPALTAFQNDTDFPILMLFAVGSALKSCCVLGNGTI